MKPTGFVCLFAIGALFFSCGSALPSIVPVDSLKPGMKGIGYSVFFGTTPERFEVEIIDVMHKTSPRGDLILARLSGAGLEHTGVIAGMSGSPVYIDNRLVGAVAYAWPFAKEPIAGITPAAEMIKIWDLPDSGTNGSRRPISPYERSSWDRPLVPIAISGMTSRLEGFITPVLNRYGFLPVTGGISSGGFDTADFVPGGAVGVALIDGDVRAAAIGTITHREGNRILAFGHPMFLAGAVRLPMTGGKIHSVIPSLVNSAKMFSPSRPVGAITQDRQTGIGGVIGLEAPMIPVQVHIQSPVTKDSYDFRVVDHEQLTPDFLTIGLTKTVLETEGLMEEYALETRLNLFFDQPGKNQVEIRHLFSGNEPIFEMMNKISAELELLYGKSVEVVKLQRVKADLRFTSGRRIAQLISARPELTVVKPGETLNIFLRLRDYRGREIERTVPIPIPTATPPGPLTINITSRDEFLAQELGSEGNVSQPRSLDQLLELLSESGREDELVIAGYVNKSGIKLNQSELSQTPPSIRRVLSSIRSIGEAQPIMVSRLFKVVLPTERVVIGSATMEVEVK